VRAALLLSGLFALPLWLAATPVSFSNSNTIIINDSTNPPTLATPYPSTISVSGLGGQLVAKVTVTLHGLSHEFPDDIDMLLIGPEGERAMLMSNVGGSTPGYAVTNLALTLDDDSASPLPLESPLVSGTFQPTMRLPYLLFDFPPPAPAGISNAPASLSVFNNTDANGTWGLYVVDDTSPHDGSISGGWTLTITTIPVVLSIAPAGTNVVLSWTNAAPGYTLQTTPSVVPPVVWTNAAPSPVIVSGRYTVTNPASGTARFYRLTQ